MRLPQDYDSEPLIEAIVALDWSTEHPVDAMQTIQATVREMFGDELSDADAQFILGRLVEGRFIRTQIHPDEVNQVGWRKVRRPAKYIRVPPSER